MNSNEQDIVSFIESLHAARHLVAEAYCNGSIDIKDENQRLLRQLQQIRAMRPNVNRDNSLRLSSPMMNLLDQAVHRVRSLAISSNFTEQITRLMTLSEGYIKSGIESRFEDQDVYASDFDLAAYDISEEVQFMLMQVNMMAHNNFANTDGYAEKIRQNDHYLSQMKKLVSTLTQLQDPSLIEMLESSFDMQPLSQVYTRHILNNMSNWRSMVMDIIHHLEKYLNKLRKVEPAAKRIRTFSMFLHRNPDYTPKDVEDYEEIPEWAYRHTGIVIKTHPDILDEATQDELISVAQSIERVKDHSTVERGEGVYEASDDEAVIQINPPPFDILIYDFVGEVLKSSEPVSAKAYFLKSNALPEIELNVKLLCFAAILENSRKMIELEVDAINVERIDSPEKYLHQGNVDILDFIACQRR